MGKTMKKNKITKVHVIVLLIAALFTASFTSHAAALIPEDGLRISSDATGKEEVESPLLTNSVKQISLTVDAVKQMGEQTVPEKIEQKIAEEHARQEEERIRKANEELLASIIFCEAGNQPYEGQVAVGAVVLNRVQSSSYPNTIEEVIYQKGQFTPAASGWLDQVRSSGGYTSEALEAARAALAGEDPVEGCLYFGCGSQGIKIGAHYFR